MAIQCFTVVRALRATAHHAVHRLAGHHTHHAHRAVVRGVASHAAHLPAVVCMVAGLATVGVGGFVAGGKVAGSSAPAPNEISGTINPPLSSGANGVANLSAGLIAAHSSRTGGSPATPFSLEWGETEDLLRTPSTLDWSEIGSPLDTWPSPIWPSPIWNEIGIPSLSWPNESNVILDTPGPPGAVPEPASVSLLTASLFGIAILSRRRRSSAGPQLIT